MSGWKEYFDNPHGLKHYVIHTGNVHMAGNIHFNRKSPGFKQFPADKRFNPVYAHLIEHPEKGYVLMDTGLHSSFADSSSGNIGYLLGRIIKTKSEAGMDVVSQLKKIHVSPDQIRYIVLSHLHADHPSALPSFRQNRSVKVYVDQDELQAAKSMVGLFQGYVKSHIAGFDLFPIKYSFQVTPFGQVLDFFGDGSIFIVRTPGHTPGHVSAILNMIDGPVFLTFDAAHRKANIDENIPPKGEYSSALKSIENIKTFIGAFPDTRVFYGHDPDQLKTLRFIPEFYS
ncbi:MAG: N-acyl homoserine lactonase family protein [Deltaproteobacteria bacterium]|nr:N-acyl homoserine lactonase family protein [Deltaproteobacteria bacterium]